MGKMMGKLDHYDGSFLNGWELKQQREDRFKRTRKMMERGWVKLIRRGRFGIQVKKGILGRITKSRRTIRESCNSQQNTQVIQF